MHHPEDWTAPGAHLVADGVYRIPLPLPQDGLRAVNVYVIETGDGLVLVDGGWALAESRDRLASALRSIGHQLSDITQFLVTHIHRDHYTQAVTLRREFGSKVSLGIGEKPALETLRRMATTGENPHLELLERAGAVPLVTVLKGWSAPLDLTQWEDPDEWLTDEARLDFPDREIQVVATPGHTQGHVVFADVKHRLLFAGDHVLPHITPSIGFEPQPPPSPLGDFLHSLARVRALPDLRLLPAHGPVADSSHQRIDELIAHHEARLAACRELVETGHDTAYAVAGQLPWTRRNRRFADLNLFNQVLATTETLAHLELLVARGELERVRDDTVARYQVARY